MLQERGETGPGALSEQPLHPIPKAGLSSLPPILCPLELPPIGQCQPAGVTGAQGCNLQSIAVSLHRGEEDRWWI